MKVSRMSSQHLLNRCIERAENLAQVYAREDPPFSLRPLLEHYGVTDVRERLLDRDARLILEDGRILIEVNLLFSELRHQFSIGHTVVPGWLASAASSNP